MSLWWMQPGWTDARCGCGKTIWPEGDPDWGMCWPCMSAGDRQAEDAYWAEQAALSSEAPPLGLEAGLPTVPLTVQADPNSSHGQTEGG